MDLGYEKERLVSGSIVMVSEEERSRDQRGPSFGYALESGEGTGREPEECLVDDVEREGPAFGHGTSFAFFVLLRAALVVHHAAVHRIWMLANNAHTDIRWTAREMHRTQSIKLVSGLSAVIKRYIGWNPDFLAQVSKEKISNYYNIFLKNKKKIDFMFIFSKENIK